jgi:hypothetical protein
VFLIVDSQMHYSVLGAPPEIVEKFEKRFGGAEALQPTSPISSASCASAAAWRREVGAGLPAQVVRLGLTS